MESWTSFEGNGRNIEKDGARAPETCEKAGQDSSRTAVRDGPREQTGWASTRSRMTRDSVSDVPGGHKGRASRAGGRFELGFSPDDSTPSHNLK